MGGVRQYGQEISTNPECRNTKEIRMTNDENTKRYDLEDRTLEFAKRVRRFQKILPCTLANTEDGKQLIRASGSIGANYLEANEPLGRKDFLMHIKISKKESKETRYWLHLVNAGSEAVLEAERAALIQESTELMKIFGAIVRKCE